MSLCLEGRSVKSALVLGFGVTGRAVVAHLEAKDVGVRISESGRLSDEDRNRLAERGILFEEGGHTGRFHAGVDAVILSPGVPIAHPAALMAQCEDIPVLSEIDLAFNEVLTGKMSVVAVTGTNGKGTTVTLIDAILRQVGIRSCVGGNIGTPFISLLEAADDCDAFVLELSSYQLEQCRRFRPHVGVLLNLTPDHLARHRTMRAYAAAKGRLFRNQQRDDLAVLPSTLSDEFTQGHARRIHFDAPVPPLPAGAENLAPHNRANLAAAICAVRELAPSLDPKTLEWDRLAEAFALPHRMQVVGSIRDVRIIDDSKSTNPDATIAALRAIKGPVVLLLGGRHKGAGYDVLAREVARPQVRQAVVFGEAGDDLERWLRSAGVVPAHVTTLAQAIDAGLGIAAPGDTLLFSPACASFDAFGSFEERGDAFLEAVRSRAAFLPRAASPPHKPA